MTFLTSTGLLGVVLLGVFAVIQQKASFPDPSTLGYRREKKIKGTAVICGGSFSGIIAARACADHFEDVVLVDPEFTKTLHEGVKTRIMQYKAAHLMLYPFVVGARRLWPQVDHRVREAGGLIADADFMFLYNGIRLLPPWKTSSTARPVSYMIRRSTLERILQNLLIEDFPNVRVLDGTVRQILLSKAELSNVESVQVRGNDGTSSTIPNPSLVIDCSGSTRAGLKWLKSAGCEVPEDKILKYDGNLSYLTVTFFPTAEVAQSLPVPGGYENAAFFMSYGTSPLVDNVGIIFNRYENNIINLVFGCWGDVALPRHPNEIESFIAQKNVSQWVINSIRILVEQSELSMDAASLPDCYRVLYEDMDHLPSNFVTLGDAAMKVNPVYGQGVTKAMISVTVLNEKFEECSNEEDLKNGFSRRYYKGIAPWNKEVWDATKTNDYGYPSTIPSAGETLATGKVNRWFADKLANVATKNEDVAERFGRVRHLMASSSILMSPKVLFPVLKYIILG